MIEPLISFDRFRRDFCIAGVIELDKLVKKPCKAIRRFDRHQKLKPLVLLRIFYRFPKVFYEVVVHRSIYNDLSIVPGAFSVGMISEEEPPYSFFKFSFG